MHAFLIIGLSESKITEKVELLANKTQSVLYEFPLQKIIDVRNLEKFLKLQSNNKTAIYIKNIDLATTEALNAFLKNLEEKDDYLYFLTARSKQNVLPTILSRCQLIRADEEELLSQVSKELEDFIKMETAERLIYISEIKSREEAIKFIDTLMIYGNKKLKNGDYTDNLVKILEAAIKVRKRLSANTNPTLQLTSFIISLDQ